MHKLLLLFLFIFLIHFSYSQTYKDIYYLNSNLVSVNEEDADIIGKGMIENNEYRLDCFHASNGNYFMVMHFADSSLSQLSGVFKSYYENGILENDGLYKYNHEDGLWLKRDSSNMLVDSITYRMGVKINYANFTWSKNKKISTVSATDSLKNTYSFIQYDSTGVETWKVNFIADTGILVSHENGKIIESIVYSRKLEEATCPGFKEHLEKNLISDIGLKNKVPMGVYTVIIKFKIDTSGNVFDILPETNIGFGMEKEGARVIKNSPKWIPASFFGRPVVALKRQPITFFYSD